MYFLAGALVTKEDIYLKDTFGQEYLAYKHKVPAILPYGWLKRTM
jgi:protein-S-isoprenylcysteine O-methyltransferase Ste14